MAAIHRLVPLFAGPATVVAAFRDPQDDRSYEHGPPRVDVHLDGYKPAQQLLQSRPIPLTQMPKFDLVRTSTPVVARCEPRVDALVVLMSAGPLSRDDARFLEESLRASTTHRTDYTVIPSAEQQDVATARRQANVASFGSCDAASLAARQDNLLARLRAQSL